MKTMRVKFTFGAIVVAAALAFASGTAAAAPANNAANVANGIESNHAAGATDISARRHLRRYRYVRPYPYVYPPSYGYAYPPAYGYYRPRPYYYRPYYGPGPFFSFGFGPRRFW